MKNQSIPPHEAQQVILKYADGIEFDIDDILSDPEHVGGPVRRVTEFLNAVLCNGSPTY